MEDFDSKGMVTDDLMVESERNHMSRCHLSATPEKSKALDRLNNRGVANDCTDRIYSVRQN
jgi:hypothetical protein